MTLHFGVDRTNITKILITIVVKYIKRLVENIRRYFYALIIKKQESWWKYGKENKFWIP